jgi:hypothetical protein
VDIDRNTHKFIPSHHFACLIEVPGRPRHGVLVPLWSPWLKCREVAHQLGGFASAKICWLL